MNFNYNNSVFTRSFNQYSLNDQHKLLIILTSFYKLVQIPHNLQVLNATQITHNTWNNYNNDSSTQKADYRRNIIAQIQKNCEVAKAFYSIDPLNGSMIPHRLLYMEFCNLVNNTTLINLNTFAITFPQLYALIPGDEHKQLVIRFINTIALVNFIYVKLRSESFEYLNTHMPLVMAALNGAGGLYDSLNMRFIWQCRVDKYYTHEQSNVRWLYDVSNLHTILAANLSDNNIQFVYDIIDALPDA